MTSEQKKILIAAILWSLSKSQKKAKYGCTYWLPLITNK